MCRINEDLAHNDQIAAPQGLPAAEEEPPPPLPGGYERGEMLHFIGASQTLGDDDYFVHGEQAEVINADEDGGLEEEEHEAQAGCQAWASRSPLSASHERGSRVEAQHSYRAACGPF